MPETSRAKADALTEGTDPRLVLATVYKVCLVLRLQAKGAELSVADVVLLMKVTRSRLSISVCAFSRLQLKSDTMVSSKVFFDHVVQRSLVPNIDYKEQCEMIKGAYCYRS